MRPDYGPEPVRVRTFTEAARRAQIISAAIRAIAEHGFARASFVRIAAEAGISPGLITYHFRTRDQLIRAVLAQIHSSFDAAMADGPEPAGYVEALTGLVTRYVRHCADHPDEAATLREIAGSASQRGTVSEYADAGNAELAGFLVEGQQHGEFRAFDPEIAATAILAVLRAVPRRLRDPGVDPDLEGREVASLCVHAVRSIEPAPAARALQTGRSTE